MTFLVRCWGNYACFTRPELKAERVSYDVMTPSAARGIMEAIYWHPGVTWKIENIWVRKPIKFTNVRRNELKNVMNGKAIVNAILNGGTLDVCDTNAQRTQRAAMILENVEYYIQASAIIDEQVCGHTEYDVNAIILRRLREGKCYHRPYFGCREFPVFFEKVESVSECPKELKGTQDMNWMLWDFDYPKPGKQPKPVFFRPTMKDGLIEIPERRDLL